MFVHGSGARLSLLPSVYDMSMTSQLVTQAVAANRAAIDVIANTTTGEHMGHAMHVALQTGARVIEQLASMLERGTGGNMSAKRSLVESRYMHSLKTLGSEKSEFKLWNEKFVGGVSHVLGTSWRKFLHASNQRLDLDRKPLSSDDVQSLIETACVDNMEQGSDDIYVVLQMKTEGDAVVRVQSGEPGEGIQAYMRIYVWFAGTTGLALSAKSAVLMNPTPVKHEYEIADALEKWSEQERTLRAHGDEYKLGAAMKSTALRLLMSCKREQFDAMERECKALNNDPMNETAFSALHARVREYAQQRRLDELTRRNKGDPMDVSLLQHDTHEMQSWNSSCFDNVQEQFVPQEQWVDALGKGKGAFKGKGKSSFKGGTVKGTGKGQCFSCGETGHFAADCRSGKAKGKG